MRAEIGKKIHKKTCHKCMTLQTDDNPYTAYIQKHMPMREKMMLQMHIISCYILIPKNEILFLSNKLCHATTAATDAIVVVCDIKT